MTSSYFVAPQRIGEILYEKAEARRQRYANRRDSLGGTSSYRLTTGGSVMTNIFPARQPRSGRVMKTVAPSSKIVSHPSTRPLSAVQSKHVQNPALVINPDKRILRDSLQSARSVNQQTIDLTVRGKKAPCTSEYSKPTASSIRKSLVQESVACHEPEIAKIAPVVLTSAEPMILEAPDSRESFERRDSLALSPSLIPYSPAPVHDLTLSPEQERQLESVVSQRKREKILLLEIDASVTSEKECSGTSTEVSFANLDENNYVHTNEPSAGASANKGQDISPFNTVSVPINSRDYTSIKDRYMRSLYSTNLQQQKMPRNRYIQGLSHIASEQKSNFSSKNFLANGAQNSRELQLDIDAYRQFCKQLVILAAEQQKIKQGLSSKISEQDDYPELNLSHEDTQRLRNMGYDIPTFCRKLLTMSSKELSNMEAEFERELNSLHKNGTVLGEQRLNHEKIKEDLKKLSKDVDIPKMRPNSANSVALSTSDVKCLIYEQQTNSLLKYSPYKTNTAQADSKLPKRKTPKVTGRQRNIKFDPSLVQCAEKKQEEYNKVQSDLYLNKLYVKSLINEHLAELGNIERIDESGRLVQSKPLMSIRSMQTLKKIPDSMVLSTASTVPVEKQSNAPSRIVATIPKVMNSKVEQETVDEVVQLKEVTPSISSESSSEYYELRKTFRSAGDHYLITSSGHYDVDAPIKEEGKPYRYKPIVVTQDEVEAYIQEQEIAKQCRTEKCNNNGNSGFHHQSDKPVIRRNVLDGNLEIFYRYSDTDSRTLNQKQADFIRNKAPVNYKDVVNYFDIFSKSNPASKPIKCAICGKIEYGTSSNEDNDTHCMSCRQVLALGRRS